MSSRKTRLASDKYNSNVLRRGHVPKGKIDSKKDSISLGPCVLAFILFVVLGSSVFAVIRAAQGGSPFR